MLQAAVCDGCTLDAFTLDEDCLGPAEVDVGRGEIVEALVCLTVQDANGVSVAFIYSRDDLHQQKWGDYNQHLTSDEARRVAATIAKLPELVRKHE